jgi:hypothetical protein
MATTSAHAYIDQIQQWRAEADARLRAEDGWLSLAGLWWLEEGSNSLGADPASAIVLPIDAPHIGRIERRGDRFSLHVAADVAVRVNGQPATERALRSDAEGAPDIVTIGDVSLLLIQRGARVGVRVRDRRSPVRLAFRGRQWFPVDEAFRVTAAFTPYDPPRAIPITNILGDTSDTPSPGFVAFTLHGRPCRLDATAGPNGGLVITFRDLTSGQSSYGSGRSVVTPPADGAEVELDFNRAVNPPCAFTAYATCPLPPQENDLQVAITAGERYEPHASAPHDAHAV